MSGRASIEELQQRDLAALLELSRALSREASLDKILELIAAKATEVIGADRSTLFLYDEESCELWSKVAEKFGHREIRFPLGVGIAGTVAKTRLREKVSDPYGDPRFNPGFDRQSGYRTRSILCTPMIGSSNNLLGVVQVLNKTGGADFDAKDEALLDAFAAHAAVALERARARDELERAHEELRTLYHAKSKMIDHLSHELKTPLSIIVASCKALESACGGADPERMARIVDRIARNVQRLAELEIEARDIAGGRDVRQNLTNVFQLARDLLATLAEAGFGDSDIAYQDLEHRLDRLFQLFEPDGESEQCVIRLHEWIPAVLRSIESLHRHRAVELRLDLRAVPAVRMPEAPLKKAFVGLVRNAIENTEDGGLVRVELGHSRGIVCLRVRDFGLGMSDAFKKQLFHGFVHAGDTESYASRSPYDFKAGGRGLDLLRTKLFAEHYGFELEVESECGRGSCFSLEFPASTQASPETEGH